MKRDDLDALVVRAPDNIVYLTNYWCMKGYDIAIFPREGEPTLIAIEPQEEDARRTSWTQDIRLSRVTIHAIRARRRFARSMLRASSERARSDRPHWTGALAGNAVRRSHGGRADHMDAAVV